MPALNSYKSASILGQQQAHQYGERVSLADKFYHVKLVFNLGHALEECLAVLSLVFQAPAQFADLGEYEACREREGALILQLQGWSCDWKLFRAGVAVYAAEELLRE